MESNLILIFTVNVLFFFSGICLNSLVILTFWRSVQLRKKICYFMILVLSCCDLLAVLTNHPLAALIALLWLTGKLDVYPNWVYISSRLSNNFLGFSLLALLVMNFDRYLATSYPIFHRTSVTKRRLLILLAIFIITEVTLSVISVQGSVISYQVLFFFIICFPQMLFFNYKLFTVARKSHRMNRTSPEMKLRMFSLKNISCCLLTSACLVVLSIPVFVYIGLRITSKGTALSLNAKRAWLWSSTMASMNCTFNCLIFFWKNKILRSEGKKVIEGIYKNISRSP